MRLGTAEDNFLCVGCQTRPNKGALAQAGRLEDMPLLLGVPQPNKGLGLTVQVLTT